MERLFARVLIPAFLFLSDCLPDTGAMSAGNPALKLRPGAKTLAVTNTFAFTTLGGNDPLTFSVASGGGTIGSSTGIYTAPASAGSATVLVTDADGLTA